MTAAGTPTILVTALIVAVALTLLLTGINPAQHDGPGLSAMAKAPPTAPSKRWGAQMAYDPMEGYTLLFGGSAGGVRQNGVIYGDTWTYSAGTWTDISPLKCTNATCPRDESYGGLSYYDAKGQQYMVLFGGRSSGNLTDDTWIFNGSWHNVTPTKLVPSRNSPPPLNYVAMTWDAKDHRDVLYGGCSTGCNRRSVSSYETWTFMGLNSAGKAVWKNRTTAIHPPGLYSEGLVYDAKDGYVLLFGGGLPGTETYLNQTWSYTAATGWINRTAASFNASNTPPFVGIIPGQLAYDPILHSVLLFGGQHFWASPTAGDKTANATLNETWLYSGGVWKNISTAQSPHPRFGAAMTFDVPEGAIILFGGLGGTGAKWTSPLLGDTWWFTGTWSNRTVS